MPALLTGMSKQRPLQNRDRPAPFRPASPTKPSASGPGDRIASPRDVAIYFREDCRTLRDSLQLEMVVAQYLLQIRDVVTTAGIPAGDVIGPRVLVWLERERDPLSHAIVRGVAHLATGDMAQRSADAVRRLTGGNVGLPPQFADVGDARAVGAWRAAGSGLDGEHALFAEFEHPRGRRHAIALFVVPQHGGVVKHIGLLGAMNELEAAGPFSPDALESVPIRVAGALIRGVLERSYGADAADSDDYRVLLATARVRSMALTAGEPGIPNRPLDP